MVFLPELRVGGMQIFRAEAFDTMGKILPRATTISLQIFVIYLGITVMCALSYVAVGLTAFDAIVHAFTTVSTGGFSNYDSSFGHFSGAVEYVAIIFMIMAALPFVRYVQLVNGNSRAIISDTQITGLVMTKLDGTAKGGVLVALADQFALPIHSSDTPAAKGASGPIIIKSISS